MPSSPETVTAAQFARDRGVDRSTVSRFLRTLTGDQMQRLIATHDDLGNPRYRLDRLRDAWDAARHKPGPQARLTDEQVADLLDQIASAAAIRRHAAVADLALDGLRHRIGAARFNQLTAGRPHAKGRDHTDTEGIQ